MHALMWMNLTLFRAVRLICVCPLSPFPTLFPVHIVHAHAHTHCTVLFQEQMKMDTQLIILKGVQHWLSSVPYTSVSCFVLPIGFSDKAGRFPIRPLLSLQSSQRAVSSTLLHLSPSVSRAHMCNIAAVHWLLILKFMAIVCCMYRKQCTYVFVTFY